MIDLPYIYIQIADEIAKAAEELIYKHYSKETPVEIEIVKEPDNMTIGTASGIM
jgi:hypothetical protein